MRTTSIACLLAFAGSYASAQSPCAPPSALSTGFDATHYLIASSVNGSNDFFDLVLSSDITVSQIDLNVANMGLAGQTTTVVVWTIPGTWVGSATNQAAWTQVATGTLTIAPAFQHSPAVFTPPFTLQAGSYGVAVQVLPANGVAVPRTGTFVCPAPPTTTWPVCRNIPWTYSDQFLALSNFRASANAWVTVLAAQPGVVNMELHYAPMPNAAYSTPVGAGCYSRPRSFYEHFTVPPGAFDLSNTSLQLVFTGNAYSVVAAPGTLYMPTSFDLGLLDDDLSPPTTLPFPLSYPGGSTNTIRIGSNGYVFLNGTATSLDYFTGQTSGLLTDEPRHAPYWGDLDPSAATGGGSVHFDVDPNGQVAYVTWLNVPEWNVLGSPNTVQLAMFASGTVEYRYGTCTMTAAPVLTGWSPGKGAADPGGMNISTSPPFPTGDGTRPLALSASARPVIGTTFNFVSEDIPAGTTGGFLFLGFGAVSPGVSLASLGMQGCSQNINPFVTQFFTVNGTSAATSQAIPNFPTLLGTRVFGQSAVLSPGVNTLGVLASNGLCIRVGQQ